MADVRTSPKIFGIPTCGTLCDNPALKISEHPGYLQCHAVLHGRQADNHIIAIGKVSNPNAHAVVLVM